MTKNSSKLPAGSSKLSPQTGILAPVPRAAGYLFFSRKAGVKPAVVLKRLKLLAAEIDGECAVLGLGAVLMNTLGRPVEGLRAFPVIDGAKVNLPVTQSDLMIWVRGNDAGEVFHQMRHWQQCCDPVFELEQSWSAFRHKSGHDLTGFEDGTENPKGRAAQQTALLATGALAGSSFVAIQPWLHDFIQFEALSAKAQNEVIGRDLQTNAELSAAPPTAHVRRTAQEDFSPEAFVLRRSMPWSDGSRGGLMFVAFGRSFDAFEAQLRRMSGAEDGVVDALFGISRPIGGGFYWCPPKAPTTGLLLP